MKILILVLSYDDDDIYTKFYETQKNTWDLEKIDGVETFYYFGNHKKNEIIGDKILVNVEEGTTLNCGYKTISAFELIKDFDFDYVFRTNSSSYIDKKLLYNFIETKNRYNHYSGFIGFHEGIKFASGSGYFISKDILNLVLDNKDEWDHTLIDDVAISQIILKRGITLINNDRFDVYSKQIPLNFFHYRLKTKDRYFDIENMLLIKKKKDEMYYGK